MPHVTAQVAPGTTEQQKYKLADAFTKAVSEAFGVPAANISVGIEESPSKTPQATVHLWPGRTDEQKHQLVDDFTKAVTKTLGVKAGPASVGFDEVDPHAWIKEIYNPQIEGKAHTLYKKPEYDRAIYNSWLKDL